MCDSQSELHVHHLYYKNKRLAWEYPDKALITVCKSCHYDIHSEIKDKKTFKTNIKINENIKKLIDNIILLNLTKKEELQLLIKTCILKYPFLFEPSASPNKMIFLKPRYPGSHAIQYMIQKHIDKLSEYKVTY